MSGATAQQRAAQESNSCGEIRSDSSCAQPRALKCRIDLERNNADAIVLAMTSPALVLTPLHANGGCVGDPCEASLSQTWRRALPKFTAACRILPELKRRNRQRTLGPNLRQGGHLCRLGFGGGNASQKNHFREQYAQHLVDVKGITLHFVFYTSPPESGK